MQDLHNHINPLLAIPPVIVTDNTAQVSSIIDRQGYDSLEFVIATGTLADADAAFTVLVEEGAASNLSDASPVVDTDLLGLEVTAGFIFSDDNKTRKIGYLGSKRYVRLTITPANNTGNAPMSVVAILAEPQYVPTPNPPA